MKAAFIRTIGAPDTIIFGELPKPAPTEHQVLVRVKAVSVNPIDTYVRSGMVAMPLPNPFVIGCDMAGVIEGLGEGVTDLSIGTRVWASNQGLLGRQGTFAEYIAVDREWLHVLPENVDFKDAAACALVSITAHLGLFSHTRLRHGETILVIGGTGGVGSMVVQMAKAAGARVIATAGSDEKAKTCKRLGADAVIARHRESIAEATKALAPDGVDVFWETRREPDFDTAVTVMAPRGRMVLMAGRDARPQFPVGPFYVKECSLHGFVMFKATPQETQAAGIDISGWLADGLLRANISHELTLEQAAYAHQLQEESTVRGSGKLAGKIVLTV